MSARRLRVLVLMHEANVPPDNAGEARAASERDQLRWQAEFDVLRALARLGHEACKLGVSDELAPIRKAIDEFRPDVVFNLLEDFHGEGTFDQHVVAYLELLRQRYTGCNPRGLTLARDKALSKKILAYHRITVPRFAVVPIGRKPRRGGRLGFPLIVKSLVEEASLGIARASLVDDDDKLAERVRFVHERLRTDAIVEEFIDGREIYSGVIGDERLRVLAPWELKFTRAPPDQPLIATEKAKWDPDYQERHGVVSEAADLALGIAAGLPRLCRRIYRALGLSGYARLDFRLDAAGKLFLLEANPNPDISESEDFARSAAVTGLPYPQLVQRILGLALQRPIVASPEG